MNLQMAAFSREIMPGATYKTQRSGELFNNMIQSNPSSMVYNIAIEASLLKSKPRSCCITRALVHTVPAQETHLVHSLPWLLLTHFPPR